MSDEKTSLKVIGVAASLATLSVPFLYIFGYAYDQGYLQGYGISNEFFARSIQEYLVLSFYALLRIAFTIVDFATKYQGLFFAIGALVFIMGLAIVFASRHHIGDRFNALAASSKMHRLFDYIFIPLMSALLAASAPYVVIMSIAAVLLIPSMAYFKGKDVAKDEIQKARVCSYGPILDGDCVYLVEKKKVVASGSFVARSSTHLALFNNGRTSILPVREQIVEVVPKYTAPNPAVEGTLRDKSAQPPSP